MGLRRYETFGYVALLGILALECVFFYSQVALQIAPFYPSRYDQLGYYIETFTLLDRFQTKGWVAFFEYLKTVGGPTGLTFAPQGAVVAIVGGGTRTAALSLNLIYFFALQLIVFQTVRARTHDRSLAWVAIGILLACSTIFQRAGGIYDYRIDFAALCLYGIWLCLLIQTRAFRDTRLSVVVGLVGALLVSMRYFVIIYLAAIYGVLLVATVGVLLRSSGPFRRPAALRLRNLLISGGVIAIVCGPLLLLASKAIYAYYVVGHVLNDEKYIRAAEMGVSTILQHVLFYPTSLLFSHLGGIAFWMIFIFALIVVGSARFYELVSLRKRLRRARCFKFDLLALCTAIVAPLLVLSANISKSQVVGGIVVVPVILLVVVLAAVIWPRGGRSAVPIAPPVSNRAMAITRFAALRQRLTAARVMAVVGAAAVVFGLGSFVQNGTKRQHYMPYADLMRVAELNRHAARWIADEAGSKAVMSLDRVVDYINPVSVWLSAYEEFHQTLEISGAFGHGPYGIFATPRDVAMALLERSDLIVLTDPKAGREAPYPMNTKIGEYWGEMHAWTTANRLPFYSTNILGIPHTIFVRPSVAITGLSAGWIVSRGVVIAPTAEDLVRWPFIVLEGQANYSVLGGVPRPKAIVIDASGTPGVELDAKLTPNGDQYVLSIDTRRAELPKSGPLNVRLTFDRFFVPKKFGINPDTRELVIMAPSRRALSTEAPH